MPGHLPWLPQVCGKMFIFTTDGNVVENNIVHKIIQPFHKIILFYFILFVYSIMFIFIHDVILTHDVVGYYVNEV